MSPSVDRQAQPTPYYVLIQRQSTRASSTLGQGPNLVLASPWISCSLLAPGPQIAKSANFVLHLLPRARTSFKPPDGAALDAVGAGGIATISGNLVATPSLDRTRLDACVRSLSSLCHAMKKKLRTVQTTQNIPHGL